VTISRARESHATERVVDGHRIRFDEATSRRMAGIRQRDTKPEQLVRRALAALGLRFRTHNRDLPGSPDIANRAKRWAVFVHGCYWHRHSGCKRATTPKRNTAFWIAKFSANVARDARARRALVARGFRVLTIWECATASDARLARSVAIFASKLGHASGKARTVASGSKSRRRRSG
jgi:DNA mismatch endonuclease (patch repair protein)